MIMMRVHRQVKAYVFSSESGSATSCQYCKLEPSWNYMHQSMLIQTVCRRNVLPITYLLAYLLIYLLTYLLTYCLTYLLNCLLTYSVALQPSAQLDARSIALHFSVSFPGCTETAAFLALGSVVSVSWSCPFRNPREFAARRCSSPRTIFCCHPFPLQELHRAARHTEVSVALPGASAAVAAPVCPRSSPTAGHRNLLGSGGSGYHLQDKYTI